MMNRRVLVMGAAVIGAAPRVTLAQTSCAARGRFSGPLVAELLPDGRKLKLTEPISYIAKCGKEWKVPAGAISDGASVPAFLWRFVGTPLVGRYRNAAVIHDWYCAVRTEPAAAVHQMFYEAMIASGVSAFEAAKFYLGVKIGGPSWDELTIANSTLASQPQTGVGPSQNLSSPVIPTSNAIGSANTPSGVRLAAAQDVIARDQKGSLEFNQMLASIPASEVALASADRLDMGAARFYLRAEQVRLATVRDMQAGMATSDTMAAPPPPSASAAPPQ